MIINLSHNKIVATIERTKNTVVGALWGTIEKISSILLPFIVRTVLIKKLGSEYLGLSSLFSSILEVLNLTELGFGAAAVFAMYKPIAEDDYCTTGAILEYLKKIYRVIGVITIIFGVLFLPFLKYTISSGMPGDVNIYVLYIIYVFNTAISYLLYAHKQSLLSALQLNYVINKITLFTNTIMRICQIVLLFMIPNYYIYAILIPVFTIISNVTCSYIVDKEYKEWFVHGTLDKTIRDDIKSRLFPLMSTKLASVLVNSADTLVISAFLGLTQVAIYNNYYYIMNSISGFLIVIYGAMQAGIGNALVVDKHEKIMTDFKKFQFINNWVVTNFTVCLLCLYQPFMELWVGKEMMLPFGMVVLFCTYFYANTIQRIVVIYKDAAGIWKEDMLRCYLSSGLNLVINIVTVRYIGLYGVIGSSVIANLVGLPWMAYILYKIVFKEKSTKFYLQEARDAFAAVIICFIVWNCCRVAPTGFGGILVRGIICLSLCNILLFLFNFKSRDYKASKKWVFGIVKRKAGLLNDNHR